MAKKILFINQEIVPYVPDSNLSLMGKALPQAMQDAGHEIRGIETAAFSHAVGCHLRIKPCLHARSPPCARSVSVSLIF